MKVSGELVISAARNRFFNWSEIWHYRELFYFFTWRDIKIKYKQTFLGFLWAVLQPLLMMLVFTLFFGHALHIQTGNIQYPVFVFSGLLLWNMFSSGLSTAATSMVNNSSIIKKIYFPRLIIPVSSILVSLFDFAMAFILFIPLLLFYGQEPGIKSLWCWPLAVLLTSLSTLGPGAWVAALNVKYRDFRYIIPFLIQILFFVTPVIYPVSMLPYDSLRYVVAMSPMFAAIELFRLPLDQAASPEWPLIFISILSSVMILIWGIYYFKRTEDFFADIA